MADDIGVSVSTLSRWRQRLDIDKTSKRKRLKCPVCGGEFSRYQNRIDRTEYTNVCSRECVYEAKREGFFQRPQKVRQADAFEALSDRPDASAHAAVVDYPWELNIKTQYGDVEFRNAPRAAQQGARDKGSEEVMFDMADEQRLEELFGILSEKLVGGAYVICFADDRFQEVIRTAIRGSPLTLRRNWAWSPNQFGMGYYGRVDHYPLPVATNGPTDRYVQERGTLYQVDEGRRVGDYPTAKPVDLYRSLLAPPVLEPGETLLEPFCGSGPGAKVATERDLGYWGCDINAEAVNKTRSRLE